MFENKDIFDEIYLYAFNYLDDYAEKEVEDIINLLKIQKTDFVLDSCCGWGRHVKEFNKYGYLVEGIDKSSVFISYARKNISKNLFYIKDVRELDLQNKYDFILNLETSFGFFSDEENRKILKNFYLALNEGGKLLLDLISFEFISKYWKEVYEILNTSSMKIIDYNYLHINKSVLDTERNIVFGNKCYKKKIKLRLYKKEELRKILTEIGFKNIEFYDNFRGKRNTTVSPHNVVVVEK